jgi:hypothetical protein
MNFGSPTYGAATSPPVLTSWPGKRRVHSQSDSACQNDLKTTIRKPFQKPFQTILTSKWSNICASLSYAHLNLENAQVDPHDFRLQISREEPLPGEA